MQEHDSLPLEHPEGEDGDEEEEEVDEEVEAVHQVGLCLGKVSVYFHLALLKFQVKVEEDLLFEVECSGKSYGRSFLFEMINGSPHH